MGGSHAVRIGRRNAWFVVRGEYRCSPVTRTQRRKAQTMIAVGLVLLLIGFLLGIPILWTLGVIVLIIGLVLMLLGATGRAVGGRRHYF